MNALCYTLAVIIALQFAVGAYVLWLTWRKPDKREKPNIRRVK